MGNDKDPNRPSTGGQLPQVDLDAWADALEAHLRAIDASVGSNRVVDAAKVAEIKQAIAGGRLQIDLDEVADGLLRALRDLMRAPKD